MNKSSRKSSKRSRRQNRPKKGNKGFVAGTASNAPVFGRGSARGDQLFTLPLLGDKFEHKRMLYYDSRFEHSAVGGVMTVAYFRANDLFDPQAAAGGHQPIGFDQAMLFWNQFCVFSSKISVTFMSNTLQAVRVGIYISPDTVNPASFIDLMENGLLKTTVVQGDGGTTGAANNLRTISLSCDCVKYFDMGSRENYFSNPNFIGTVAASPVEMCYFGVFTYDFTGANNYDVFYDVTMSYDARFQEPRKIPHSLLTSALRTLQVEEKKESPVVITHTNTCKLG
jgi:hypothetical protein